MLMPLGRVALKGGGLWGPENPKDLLSGVRRRRILTKSHIALVGEALCLIWRPWTLIGMMLFKTMRGNTKRTIYANDELGLDMIGYFNNVTVIDKSQPFSLHHYTMTSFLLFVTSFNYSGDAGTLVDSYISGKITQLKEQIATLEKREER